MPQPKGSAFLPCWNHLFSRLSSNASIFQVAKALSNLTALLPHFRKQHRRDSTTAFGERKVLLSALSSSQSVALGLLSSTL